MACKCTKIFSHPVRPAIRHDRVITPWLRGYHARPLNHASFRALSKSDYRTMPRKFDSTAAATYRKINVRQPRTTASDRRGTCGRRDGGKDRRRRRRRRGEKVGDSFILPPLAYNSIASLVPLSLSRRRRGGRRLPHFVPTSNSRFRR